MSRFSWIKEGRKLISCSPYERDAKATRQLQNENDVLFSNDTGILGKRKSECCYQESNLKLGLNDLTLLYNRFVSSTVLKSRLNASTFVDRKENILLTKKC